MYFARIVNGAVMPVVHVPDEEGCIRGDCLVVRPRVPRAWRFTQTRNSVVIATGAAAYSQSPEGALASARAVLEENPVEFKFQPKREIV